MQLCRQITRWLLGRQIHVNRDNHGWLSMGQNNTMKKSVYCPHTIHPGQFAVGQLQANYPMKKVFPVHTIHPAWYAGECRFNLPAPCVKQGHSGTVGKVLSHVRVVQRKLVRSILLSALQHTCTLFLSLFRAHQYPTCYTGLSICQKAVPPQEMLAIKC